LPEAEVEYLNLDREAHRTRTTATKKAEAAEAVR
jgi:hypothetical protein